ncbi:serine-rich adhesin for platelets-like [Littorina saxatilis]|uniref:Uncharacterized protein n=1 Tax=Littorina saxatilis TaxID=31220 RepID=A0AAN9BNC1_9CAEN
MDEQKQHCDLLLPRPDCPEEENCTAHDGESNTEKAYGTPNNIDSDDHNAHIELAAIKLTLMDNTEEDRLVLNEHDYTAQEEQLLKELNDPSEKDKLRFQIEDTARQDQEVINVMNHSAKIETDNETDSSGSEQHATISRNHGAEGNKLNDERKSSAEEEDERLHGTNQVCFDGEGRPNNDLVDPNGKQHARLVECDQKEQCASVEQRDCSQDAKHSTENDPADSEASAAYCNDNCDNTIEDDEKEKHGGSRLNINSNGKYDTNHTDSVTVEKTLLEDQVNSMARENSGSFHDCNAEETNADQRQAESTESETGKGSNANPEQIDDSHTSPERQRDYQKPANCTDNAGDNMVPPAKDSTASHQNTTTGGTSSNSKDNQPRRRPSANETCDHDSSLPSADRPVLTEEPNSSQSTGEVPPFHSQPCDAAIFSEKVSSSDHQSTDDTISSEKVSSTDNLNTHDTLSSEKVSSSDQQSTDDIFSSEKVSSTDKQCALDTISLEKVSSKDNQSTVNIISSETVSKDNQCAVDTAISSQSVSPKDRQCSKDGADTEEQQDDTLDGNHPQQQQQQLNGGNQGREADKSPWTKRGDEYCECSDSTGDEEEVDPRIAENLEIMNQSCADVNRLENELDEARNKYRSTFQTSSQRMEELASKIKKSIQRARPFFEMTEKAKEAQNEAVRAARQFQTASGNYRAAKEMITLAELSLSERDEHTTRSISCALQETLNHATERVMESEREKTRSEAVHNKRAGVYAQLESQLQSEEKKYKRSISKARPYFDTKAELELKLQQQKQNVWDLQQAISTRKARYAEALRNLEAVSTEIHESRRSRQKMLLQYPREPGVGAESDSLCSSISDNIERNVFSSNGSYDYDDEDEEELSDDSSEVFSPGSRGYSRQNSRDRSLVTKTSSLRREIKRHRRSVSNGSAPGSVFSSSPGSLPESPASLNAPDASNGFSVVPGLANDGGGVGGGGGGSDGVKTTTTAIASATVSSSSNASVSVSTPSQSTSVSIPSSARSASASGTMSPSRASTSVTSGPSSTASASGLPPRLMDIAQGDCSENDSDDDAHGIKEYTAAEERGETDHQRARDTTSTDTVTSVEIQERVDGDGSAQEDCSPQGERDAVSTLNANTTPACAGSSASPSPLPSNQQSVPVTGSTAPLPSQNSLGSASSGQHPTGNTVSPPPTDQPHTTPKQLFAKAKQFLKKKTSGPQAHPRLDNRASEGSAGQDVNANPQARTLFHTGSGPHQSNSVQLLYPGPGLTPTGNVNVSTCNSSLPPRHPSSVQSAKASLEVKKQPLKRTDGGRNKPLQGIFVLNPSDLASSSPSSSSSSSFRF